MALLSCIVPCYTLNVRITYGHHCMSWLAANYDRPQKSRPSGAACIHWSETVSVLTQTEADEADCHQSHDHGQQTEA